jgi:hypothetical protein
MQATVKKQCSWEEKYYLPFSANGYLFVGSLLVSFRQRGKKKTIESKRVVKKRRRTKDKDLRETLYHAHTGHMFKLRRFRKRTDPPP